jgi:hypothetical protein
MTHATTITMSALVLATLAASSAVGALIFWRGRAPKASLKGALSALALVVLLLAPFLADAFIVGLNRSSGVQRVFIDPGVVTLMTPSAVAFFVGLIVAAGRQRAWPSS